MTSEEDNRHTGLTGRIKRVAEDWESEHPHPHVEEFKEKAQEPTTVHGHQMRMAEIFKAIGLLAFFALMAVACVLLWPYIHELFEPGGVDRVIHDVREAGLAGGFVLLGIQFLQIVTVVIPGEVVQIAAGMIYGPWLGAFIIWAGCVISSAFIFVLVRKLGAPFVQAMVSDKYMSKFREFERSRKFNIIVFVLFLIPGLPKDAFTYITPLTHMSMKAYLLITNIARIPGIVMSTYAAAGLISGDFVESAIIFGVTGLLAVAGLLGYNKYMHRVESKTGKHGLGLRNYELEDAFIEVRDVRDEREECEGREGCEGCEEREGRDVRGEREEPKPHENPEKSRR